MKKNVSLSTAIVLLCAAMPVLAGQQTSPPAGNSNSGKPSEPAARQSSPAPASPPATDKSAANNPASGGAAQPKKTDPTPPDSGYVIGPQDILAIDVWQEKELSVKAEVRPDGKITLPLVNDVQAAGLKPEELRDVLTKALAKYVTDPRVTVMVDQINSQLVFMMGEVNRPGPMPLVRKTIVLQALTMVGGPNQFANARKIYILRTVNGKTVRFPFDYKKAIKLGPGKDNIVLQPGDTVVVP